MASAANRCRYRSDTGPFRPRRPSVRPGPGHGWPPPGGCAPADHPPGWSGGRTRPPATLVRTHAGHRRDRDGPPGARPVGRRLADTGVVGVKHRPPGGRIAQTVEHRHALGRAQHHIERGHGIAAMGAAEQFASGRVAALEHPPEVRRRCFALQPERPGAGAVPAAWTLAVAGQILLVVGGQLAGVILLPPHRELRDVGHHPDCSLPPSLASATHPWCIALLRRLRVERRAIGEASSVWQVLEALREAVQSHGSVALA
jgi:hypothetical protein